MTAPRYEASTGATPTPATGSDANKAAKPKLTAKERFERGWVDSDYDTLSGRFYGKYEFYQKDIDIIKAALESSPPADYTDIVGKVEVAGKKYLDERDKEYKSLKDEGEDEMGRDWTGPYMAAESNKKTGAQAMLKIVLAILTPQAQNAKEEG